jgi:hypothetical protein
MADKKEEYKVGYKHPPKNRQFGQPEGNPTQRSWKKEDTPRYKLEKMITLKDDELKAIQNDAEAPSFEKAIASIILQAKDDTDASGTPRPASLRFQAIEKIINQVYGSPAQTQVTVDAGSMEEKEKSGFIKGVFIPQGEKNE